MYNQAGLLGDREQRNTRRGTARSFRMDITVITGNADGGSPPMGASTISYIISEASPTN